MTSKTSDMKPIIFEQANILMAGYQDEYHTLPAHHDPVNGILTSCWELTPEEAEIVRNTGRIWFQQLTFNQPMQPVMLTTENPLEP